jgi:hypothetical protein
VEEAAVETLGCTVPQAARTAEKVDALSLASPKAQVTANAVPR